VKTTPRRVGHRPIKHHRPLISQRRWADKLLDGSQLQITELAKRRATSTGERLSPIDQRKKGRDSKAVTTFLTGSRASLRSAAPSGSACPRCAAGRSACRRREEVQCGIWLGGDPISQDLLGSDRHQGSFASLRDDLRSPLTPVTAEKLG
jgi:hypothetical protein